MASPNPLSRSAKNATGEVANPYTPPLSEPQLTTAALRFDGIVSHPIAFEHTFTPEEYRSLSRNYWLIGSGLFLFCLFIIAATSMFYFGAVRMAGPWMMMAFLFFVSFGMFIVGLGPLARRRWRSSSHDLLGPCRGTLSAEGLQLKFEKTQANLTWDAIFACQFHKEQALLFPSTALSRVIVFSSRTFATDEDWSIAKLAFKELSQHVPFPGQLHRPKHLSQDFDAATSENQTIPEDAFPFEGTVLACHTTQVHGIWSRIFPFVPATLILSFQVYQSQQMITLFVYAPMICIVSSFWLFQYFFNRRKVLTTKGFVSPRGVYLRTPISQWEYDWSAIRASKATKRGLLINTSRATTVHILPAFLFKNQEQWEQVRVLASSIARSNR